MNPRNHSREARHDAAGTGEPPGTLLYSLDKVAELTTLIGLPSAREVAA